MSVVTPFQLEVRQYVKAVVAGLIAAIGVLAGAAGDGISTQELLTALATGLGGFVATFYAPNKAAEGQPDNPALSEQSGELADDLGHVLALYAVGMALLLAGLIVAVVGSLTTGVVLAVAGVGCLAVSKSRA